MKKKIVLLTLFSVFLLSAMTVPSLSQVTVGVSVGDTFTWVGTYTHETNDPSQMVPGQVSPYAFWNETDSMNATVTEISGTNVTFEKVWYYSNGTDVTETEVQNITNTPVGYLCIGADLEAGDDFTQYDSYSYGPLQINKTETFEYGDLTRDTNYHISITGLWAVVTRQYWFDKETGICVRAQLTAVLEGISTTEYILELTATNLWVVPEFPTGTVMLFVFVAVIVPIALYRRKN